MIVTVPIVCAAIVHFVFIMWLRYHDTRECGVLTLCSTNGHVVAPLRTSNPTVSAAKLHVHVIGFLKP